MVDEKNFPDLPAGVADYVAKVKRRLRWIMVAVSGLIGAAFIGLLIVLRQFGELKFFPAPYLIIPTGSWFMSFVLQVLAAALGPDEELNEQDGARARSVRRWRQVSLAGARAVWLLAFVIGFFIMTQDYHPQSHDEWTAYWAYSILWGCLTYFTIRLMMLFDTKSLGRNLRLQAMRKVLASQTADQFDLVHFDKLKRKTGLPAPLIGDDGELIAPDSAEHPAKTHKW